MTQILLYVLYGIGWVVFWIWFTRWIVMDDPDAWPAIMILSTMVSFFWPIVFVGMTVYKLANSKRWTLFVLGQRGVHAVTVHRAEKIEREMEHEERMKKPLF